MLSRQGFPTRRETAQAYPVEVWGRFAFTKANVRSFASSRTNLSLRSDRKPEQSHEYVTACL